MFCSGIVWYKNLGYVNLHIRHRTSGVSAEIVGAGKHEPL